MSEVVDYTVYNRLKCQMRRKMIKLFDRIVLNQDLPEKKNQNAVMWDFFYKTYTVETPSADPIRSVKKNEVTHVRELT